MNKYRLNFLDGGEMEVELSEKQWEYFKTKLSKGECVPYFTTTKEKKKYGDVRLGVIVGVHLINKK